MNNILSYCGLVDTRISASEKDLPVSAFKLKRSSPCIKKYNLGLQNCKQ